MKPLAVLGSLNMDLVVRSPRLPAPGETLLGGPFQTFPGGKGANQAVAIARLEAPVTLIGRVGADAFGAELLASAGQAGVDTGHILRDKQAATGVALITVEDAGQNTIVVALGANGRVSPAQVQSSAAVIQEASLLVMQLECPLDAVTEAARLARLAGVRVLLNPAPAAPLPAELLKQVDILAPNQSELAALQPGLPVSEAAHRLQALGVPVVLVTLGADGVYMLAGDEETSLPAFKVEAVDTVAAGDAFIGAFAVALAEGKPLHEAVRWGNAGGAIAVTRHGAQPSIPNRDELLKFLEEHA